MTRLGMLTPSSNTVLEPVTAELLAGRPDLSAHFSRFRVTEIALTEAANAQFESETMLRAADLLADAKVDAIAWNGTSASWLGFETDENLCRQIEARTGIAACTSALAFRDVFRRDGIKRVGLLTPYRDDVQRRIMANWERSGFSCTAERHLDLSDNFSFATVDEETIAAMARALAGEGCDAIAIVCTNLRGALVAPVLERELGLPVYDSVTVTLWRSLLAAKADQTGLERWGGPFRAGAPGARA